MNNLKVFTLLAGMTAVMGMLGQAMGGQSGMLIALLITGLMNFYMYFTSSTKVMRAYKAQTVTRAHVCSALGGTACAGQPAVGVQGIIEVILDPPLDRGTGCTPAGNGCCADPVSKSTVATGQLVTGPVGRIRIAAYQTSAADGRCVSLVN